MNFYLIDNELFKDLKYAYGQKINPIHLGEATKCDKCNRYLTLKPWLPPYKMKISRPYLGDFITGSIQRFAVSENFKKAYEESGLKGLSDFQPVELYYKKDIVDNERYYYPQMALSTVRIDFEKSGISFTENNVCSLCQQGDGDIIGMKGIIFENPEQVKEDVFDTRFFPGPMVSERFKQFVEDNKFTNLIMKDLSTYVPHWLRSPFDGFKIDWNYKKKGK